jgi:hypothetical protein
VPDAVDTDATVGAAPDADDIERALLELRARR